MHTIFTSASLVPLLTFMGSEFLVVIVVAIANDFICTFDFVCVAITIHLFGAFTLVVAVALSRSQVFCFRSGNLSYWVLLFWFWDLDLQTSIKLQIKFYFEMKRIWVLIKWGSKIVLVKELSDWWIIFYLCDSACLEFSVTKRCFFINIILIYFQVGKRSE